MIIGHRSYTFSCDGDLIEVEPLSPPTPTENHEPKPKPLVHKDSVLSTATSMSLTSVDSDSDTDDHSSSFSTQNRRNLIHAHQPSSPPKSLHFSTPNNSQESEIQHSQEIYPPFSPVSKRMSSTSLSSWESEAMSPVNPCSDMITGMRHQSIDEESLDPLDHGDDDDDGGLKMVVKRSNRYHSTPDSPLSTSWPMRYESIDEDSEVKSESISLSTSNIEQSHEISSSSDRHKHKLKQQAGLKNDHPVETHKPNGKEAECLSELSESSGKAKATKTHEQQVQIQKHVISLLQLRRSSLKRQQRILDDDEPVNISDKDNSDVMDVHKSLSTNSGHVERAQMQDEEEKSRESGNDFDVFMDTIPVSETIDSNIVGEKIENFEFIQNDGQKIESDEQKPVLSLIADITVEQTEIQLTKCEEVLLEPRFTKPEPDLLHVVNMDMKGDSFEMEEVS